jgi:hypothetical protein
MTDDKGRAHKYPPRKAEPLRQCCAGSNAFYCIQCEQRDVQATSDREARCALSSGS